MYFKNLIRKIMKQLLIVMLSVLMIYGCKSGSDYVVKGNGKIVSFEVPVNNYSRIDLSGSCELVYEQKMNKSPYLKVEIDENLRDMLDIRTHNGKLSVSLKGNVSYAKFKVYTNSNELDRMNISGSGKIRLKNNINSPNLKVSISGTGNLKADKLKCTNLSLSMSGAGSAALNGEVYNSEIHISGSGEVDAYKLKSQNTMVKVSGAGNAKVYVTELFDAKVSGSGNINYKGSPKKKNVKVLGSGKINDK